MNKRTQNYLFWLYTRTVYSTMQRSVTEFGTHVFCATVNYIRTDSIFIFYKLFHFSNINMKQKIMIFLLQNQHWKIIFFLVVFMGVCRTNFPALFSIIKR